MAPSLNRLADGSLYFTVKDLVGLGRGPARAEVHERGELRRLVDAGVARERYELPLRLRLVARRAARRAADRARRLVAGLPRRDRPLRGSGPDGRRAREPRQPPSPRRWPTRSPGSWNRSCSCPTPGRRSPTPIRRGPPRCAGVLAAWSDSRVVPAMATGLADTASGSAREAYDRLRTGRRVAGAHRVPLPRRGRSERRPPSRRGENVTTHRPLRPRHRRTRATSTAST